MRVQMMMALLMALGSVSLPASRAVAEDLYRPDSFRSLISDRRAYRPGDALTVLIVESSSATSSADTTTEKSAGLGLSLKSPSTNKEYGFDLNEDFNGRGRIQRSGRLLAQITVVVEAIDPNGQLLVRGYQVIDVNNEKQEIRLEGRVRPSDVQDNNTVLSTRIADAKIAYIGDGLLAEKQRPGILTRILSWLRIL